MFDVFECKCRYVSVSKHFCRLFKNQENMFKLLKFLCIKKNMNIENIFSNKICVTKKRRLIRSCENTLTCIGNLSMPAN